MAIMGKVENGQIHVSAPQDWPEGCEVVIEPVNARTSVGMREADWPTTPEAIAALLKRWDMHEPLEMTPNEEAAWDQARRSQNELDKATFAEDGEKLRRLWE